jgi:hypothetical protein
MSVRQQCCAVRPNSNGYTELIAESWTQCVTSAGPRALVFIRVDADDAFGGCGHSPADADDEVAGQDDVPVEAPLQP